MVGDEPTIVDMAIAQWVLPDLHGQTLSDFPNIARYLQTLKARPRWARGAAVGKELQAPLTEEAKKILFQRGK